MRILDDNTAKVQMGTLCIVQDTQGCFSLDTSAGKQYKRIYKRAKKRNKKKRKAIKRRRNKIFGQIRERIKTLERQKLEQLAIDLD
jgi:hypothetical protein